MQVSEPQLISQEGVDVAQYRSGDQILGEHRLPELRSDQAEDGGCSRAVAGDVHLTGADLGPHPFGRGLQFVEQAGFDGVVGDEIPLAEVLLFRGF